MKTHPYSKKPSFEEIPILKRLERQHTLLNTAVDPANPEWHELTLRTRKHMESFSTSIDSRMNMSTSSQSEPCLSTTATTSSSNEMHEALLPDSSLPPPPPGTGLVITDTDLASSWLYKSKKGMYRAEDRGVTNEAFEHSPMDLLDSPPSMMAPPPPIFPTPPPRNSNTSSEDCREPFLMPPVVRLPKKAQKSFDDYDDCPDDGFSKIRLKPIPIAKKQRSKSTCCCYLTVLMVVFVCMFGLLSAIGGIVYLEVFTTRRTVGELVKGTVDSNTADVEGHLKIKANDDGNEVALGAVGVGSSTHSFPKSESKSSSVENPNIGPQSRLSSRTDSKQIVHVNNVANTNTRYHPEYNSRVGEMYLDGDDNAEDTIENNRQGKENQAKIPQVIDEVPDWQTSLIDNQEESVNKNSKTGKFSEIPVNEIIADLDYFLVEMSSKPEDGTVRIHKSDTDCDGATDGDKSDDNSKKVPCQTLVISHSRNIDRGVDPSFTTEPKKSQGNTESKKQITVTEDHTSPGKNIALQELSHENSPSRSFDDLQHKRINHSMFEKRNDSRTSKPVNILAIKSTENPRDEHVESVRLPAVLGGINSKPLIETDFEGPVQNISPTPVLRNFFSRTRSPLLGSSVNQFENQFKQISTGSSKSPSNLVRLDGTERHATSEIDSADFNIDANDDFNTEDMFPELDLIDSDDDTPISIVSVDKQRITPDPHIPAELLRPVSGLNIPTPKIKKLPQVAMMPSGFDKIIQHLKRSNSGQLPIGPKIPSKSMEFGAKRHQMTPTTPESDPFSNIFGIQKPKQGNLQDSIAAVLKRFQKLEYNNLPVARVADTSKSQRRPRNFPVGADDFEKKLYLDKIRAMLYENK